MSAEPKTVTLIDPQGNKCIASHPADIVNLVYGSGYKVEGKQTPEEAAALLAEKGVAAVEQTAVATQETKTASK